jgi:phosphonate transport system substrate-binding protein
MDVVMVKIVAPFLLLTLLLFSSSQAAESSVKPPIRIGLTPVFLDDQAAFVNTWHGYIKRHLGRPIAFVQRGSYREVVEMLLEGKLDFAWLCGYPYVRNKAHLRLVAVPLYKSEPLYRSYLIVPSSDKKTRSLEDLRGKVFALSDPDSNSGYLYPEYLLAQQGEESFSFFAKTFFTWSHRKVIEAVAIGLAQGGAVDGYVWDTLSKSHPELTSQTRIVIESPPFGYPPFVAGTAASTQDIAAMQRMLLGMEQDKDGGLLLKALNLDGFVRGNEHLYDEIEQMSRLVEKGRN